MSDDGFTLEELKIAYAFRIAQQIAGADGEIRPEEAQLIGHNFPLALMRAHGFLGKDGPLPRLFEAAALAMQVLPGELSRDERLDLAVFFFNVCRIDGSVDPREIDVFAVALENLQLEPSEFDQRMSELAILEANQPDEEPHLDPGDPLLQEGWRRLRVAQHQLFASFSRLAEGEALLRRQRIIELLRNPAGSLSVVTFADEVSQGFVGGWLALLRGLKEEGLLSDVAGRLILETEGYDDDPRELFQIPEAHRWLVLLANRVPWLPVWLDPTIPVAAQFIASGGGIEVNAGGASVTERGINLAVYMANNAVAATRSLGSSRMDHIWSFLAVFGIAEQPPGFFDGVETFAAGMDDDLFVPEQ